MFSRVSGNQDKLTFFHKEVRIILNQNIKIPPHPISQIAPLDRKHSKQLNVLRSSLFTIKEPNNTRWLPSYSHITNRPEVT